jgi:hypothetical protein
MKGLQHRIGGIEKEDKTGNISYEPQNHELMVKLRAEKVQRIVDTYRPIRLDSGPENGDLLIVGWGSRMAPSVRQRWSCRRKATAWRTCICGTCSPSTRDCAAC